MHPARLIQLHNGNCLPILTSMPSESVDAVITDPPYCSGGASAKLRTTQDPTKKYQNSGTIRTYPTFPGDNRDQRSFGMWATLWLEQCYRVARESAHCLVFTDWRQLPVMTDAIQAAGWT